MAKAVDTDSACDWTMDSDKVLGSISGPDTTWSLVAVQASQIGTTPMVSHSYLDIIIDLGSKQAVHISWFLTNVTR